MIFHKQLAFRAGTCAVLGADLAGSKWRPHASVGSFNGLFKH